MRKFGIITLLACALAMCLVLAGCGNKASKDAAFVGTWSLNSIESATEANSMSAEDLALLNDMGVTVTLALNEDHTFALNTGNQQMTGTWKAKKNNTGTMTVDGYKDAVDISVGEDGMLTFQQAGETLHFTQGTATPAANAADSASASDSASATDNAAATDDAAASDGASATDEAAATDTSATDGTAANTGETGGDVNVTDTTTDDGTAAAAA
jgi:hypothetical protein